MQDIRNIASMNIDEGRSAAQTVIEKLQYGKMTEEEIWKYLKLLKIY